SLPLSLSLSLSLSPSLPLSPSLSLSLPLSPSLSLSLLLSPSLSLSHNFPLTTHIFSLLSLSAPLSLSSFSLLPPFLFLFFFLSLSLSPSLTLSLFLEPLFSLRLSSSLCSSSLFLPPLPPLSSLSHPYTTLFAGQFRLVSVERTGRAQRKQLSIHSS